MQSNYRAERVSVQAVVLNLLQDLKADYGLTIIIIEHVMQALMRLADSILVLHLGRRVTHGTPSEIVQHPEVLRAYLGAPA